MSDSVQDSFNTTLKVSDLSILGAELLEAGVDSVLKDGLLKEVPVVSTIVGLSKMGANIQDRIFLRKLLSFLYPLKDIKPEVRIRMIEEIDSSNQYRVRVGEKLMYIIDSSGDHEIAELVSRVFKAYLEERISYQDFLEAAAILKDLNIDTFQWFVQEREYYQFELGEVGHLLNTGLFELFYDEVTVDVNNKVDLITRQKLGDQFETEVDGGVGVGVSRSGMIILELFCPTYTPRRPILKTVDQSARDASIR